MQLKWIFVFALMTTASAQTVRPLVRALKLQEQAQEKVAACRLEEAIQILDSADRVLTESKEESEMDGAARGNVQAELDQSRRELMERTREVKEGKKQARRLLQQTDVESAASAWQGYQGPICDAAFGKTVEAERKRARDLEKQALRAGIDRRVELLEQAERVNRELPGLSLQLSEARKAKANQPCYACRTAKRVVKGVVITGIVGAGSYYGWQYYQDYRRRNPGSPARVCVGPACRF